MDEPLSPIGVLFADITDSSGLIHSLGELEARRAILGCLDVLAEAATLHGGEVVDRIGDEIMCTFPTARDTFDAAIQLQRALVAARAAGRAREEIRIRIGCHFGSALREAGTVFGETVHVARRLATVAKAEQIVTSEEVVRAGSHGDDITWRPIEVAYLKGIARPIQVFEVVWDPHQSTWLDLESPSVAPSGSQQLSLNHGADTVVLDAGRPAATIGRDVKCDLVIDEFRVSRVHVRIELRKAGFVAIDQSANGTLIATQDGEPQLLHRDECLLGRQGTIMLAPVGEGEARRVVTFQES